MWLRLLIILNFSFLIFNCHSYGQRPIGIAFYDVDRIYDTVPALFYDDADYTPEGRLHWTAERYARKIRNTAAVIDSMALPLVALWGVENEQVRGATSPPPAGATTPTSTARSIRSTEWILRCSTTGTSSTRPATSRDAATSTSRANSDATPWGWRCAATHAWPNGSCATCVRSRPHVKLIVLGRSDLPDPGRWGLRDATRRAEQAGRGTVRRGGRWQMRDRILADTALTTSEGDVFARRYLVDQKSGNPLTTYSRGVYRGGYGYSLPVFIYIR